MSEPDTGHPPLPPESEWRELLAAYREGPCPLCQADDRTGSGGIDHYDHCPLSAESARRRFE